MHICGISINGANHVPPQELSKVQINTIDGLAGEVRYKNATTQKGQVAVISANLWRAACNDAHLELPWHTRRSNLCIEGLEICGAEDVGRKFCMGNVVLEIMSETESHKLNDVHLGLNSALKSHWRAGYICHVLFGGTVFLEDSVIFD